LKSYSTLKFVRFFLDHPVYVKRKSRITILNLERCKTINTKQTRRLQLVHGSKFHNTVNFAMSSNYVITNCCKRPVFIVSEPLHIYSSHNKGLIVKSIL